MLLSCNQNKHTEASRQAFMNALVPSTYIWKKKPAFDLKPFQTALLTITLINLQDYISRPQVCISNLATKGTL